VDQGFELNSNTNDTVSSWSQNKYLTETKISEQCTPEYCDKTYIERSHYIVHCCTVHKINQTSDSQSGIKHSGYTTAYHWIQLSSSAMWKSMSNLQDNRNEHTVNGSQGANAIHRNFTNCIWYRHRVHSLSTCLKYRSNSSLQA